jgi:phosphate transport system permease protein
MTTVVPDPEYALTPSANLSRRMRVSSLVVAGATASAIVAVGVLGLVLYTVVHRGGGALSWHFLTGDLPPFGQSGGGIAPAIVGTGVIVGIAALIATPVGVLTALYLTEFAGHRTGRIVRVALDLMNGLPTIVIGVFIFGLLVASRGQSGFAGSVALSIVMVPLIARSSQEVLLRVPYTLREAAEALGVSHWRTVIGVILPTALSGIVTGTILAVARAAGETAPLILASSIYGANVDVNPFHFGHGLANIPVHIFTLVEAGDPAGFSEAWGAAFVLMAFILLANIGARTLIGRNKAALGR